MGFADVIPVQRLKRIHRDKIGGLRANIVKVADEDSPTAEALLSLGKLELALESKKERYLELPAFLFVIRECH